MATEAQYVKFLKGIKRLEAHKAEMRKDDAAQRDARKLMPAR